MNRNPATIFSKLDIIACNIRIFVFETKDMYGSGNVSTTQHSTEITPKTSNIKQVSKKTTTFTIHQSTWGVLSKQPLPSTFCWSKVQTPRLIIIYDIPSMFLSSSPDLGGRQLQDPRAGEVYLVVWRDITGNIIPSLYSPQFIQSSLKCYHPKWEGSSYYTMEHTYIVCTDLTLHVVDRFFDWYIRCL